MSKRIALGLRIILGAVFIYAAYSKLRQSWLLFALSIDSYQLLPEWAVYAVARTLPWLELTLGALLIAGIWLRYLSLLASTILTVFFTILLVSYFRGASIDCGCFGVGEALSAKTLARDALLMTAALTLAALAWRKPDSGFGSNPQSPIPNP
ncbi:MAG: DoxX family membrane protein [Acidobacteria bacterium]|nr:MAG: DoxX family membrane protein [Acidobacteriota bacterium]